VVGSGRNLLCVVAVIDMDIVRVNTIHNSTIDVFDIFVNELMLIFYGNGLGKGFMKVLYIYIF
jgi:hypothetical protein